MGTLPGSVRIALIIAQSKRMKNMWKTMIAAIMRFRLTVYKKLIIYSYTNTKQLKPMNTRTPPKWGLNSLPKETSRRLIIQKISTERVYSNKIQEPYLNMQHQTKPLDSLIKYETQIEISHNAVEYNKHKSSQRTLDSKPSPQDVLNAIIPPRQWVSQDNRLFLQYVSHQNASRQSVLQLKELLQNRLKERQARESGICPIREELFSQCFDEIIRQVTIDCPQRGLLLMRTRDQLKMTIAAYQTLYQSSVTFGIRKQVQSQEGKQQLYTQVDELTKLKTKLEQKKIELLSKKESLEKKIQERKMIQKQKRQQQLRFLAFQGQNLSKFLDSVKTEQK